ncbi:hypothetical protein MPSEU_000499100 [Mayamaea pseudoterrestris]|nr:hypothetical protein MPSEU_000499100 [Mayamaea pseudoterrestris]
MSSPAFAGALDKTQDHVGQGHGMHHGHGVSDGKHKQLDNKDHHQHLPVAHGIPVTLPEAMPSGHPIFDGLQLWVPPKANVYQDGLPVYEILGTDAQIVQIPLRAGRQVMCFSGAMCYMSQGMTMVAELAGFGKTFGRLAGGGSLFQLTFTNTTQEDGYIAMTPDYPGVIVPIHMNECPSGTIVAMRDSFLCSTVGLEGQGCNIGAGFNPASSIGGFCCSGVDFIVQTVSNGEWAFLMAMGTVITRNLQAGEKILVDTDAILCFEQSVSIDIQWVGNVAAICCGGEGIFNTTMTGPGKIWIQSMGIDKMRRLFPPNVQKQGDNSGGGLGDDGGS